MGGKSGGIPGPIGRGNPLLPKQLNAELDGVKIIQPNGVKRRVSKAPASNSSKLDRVEDIGTKLLRSLWADGLSEKEKTSLERSVKQLGLKETEKTVFNQGVQVRAALDNVNSNTGYKACCKKMQGYIRSLSSYEKTVKVQLSNQLTKLGHFFASEESLFAFIQDEKKELIRSFRDQTLVMLKESKDRLNLMARSETLKAADLEAFLELVDQMNGVMPDLKKLAPSDTSIAAIVADTPAAIKMVTKQLKKLKKAEGK